MMIGHSNMTQESFISAKKLYIMDREEKAGALPASASEFYLPLCDLVIITGSAAINKIDVMNVFDFDLEKCKEYVWRLNPNMKVIPICAKTGEGVQEWADWLREQTLNWIR